MATAVEKPAKFAPDDPKVYHPLDNLRGIIYRYVLVEALVTAALLLAIWYVLALVLDYGIFKAFTWDWVQDGASWFRSAALLASLAVFAAIVLYELVRRLRTELTYPALALILERRFPDVLGDRLITAVELADVEDVAKYGYSKAMIRQTIEEAREKVAGVAVGEAFNWRRLQKRALLAFGVLVAVAASALAIHSIAVGGFRPVEAGWKLFHVSAIVAERNVLLMDTPWPRRSLLELDPNIKESGLRVARDGAAPRVKVKSFRWVVADRKVPDGWRALKWSEVTGSLIGVPVPQIPFESMGYPDEKSALSSEPQDWSADAVWERARESAAVRDKLSSAMGSDPYRALQDAFDRLEAMAADPAQWRTLRHLDPPESVAYEYVGSRTSGGGPMNSEGKGEFAGEIGGLREDVIFVIKAEDYRTPPRAITLIPPPSLIKLDRVEYQPAYLYYAPPLVPNPESPNEMMQLGFSSLKGKLQKMPEEKMSLTGDKSIFSVPEGTELTITGATELPIAKAFVRPKVGKIPGAAQGSAALVPLPLLDANTFTLEFRSADRLTGTVEFDFVFENEDKVVSARTVLIQVVEDQAPSVEVVPEIIRRIGPLYYITPRAKIPFNPESSISDDRGLSKVEYAATYWPEDSPIGRAMRCGLVTRAVLAPAGLSGALLPTTLQTIYHANAVRSLDKGDSRLSASFLLGSYLNLSSKVAAETRDRLDQLLAEPLAGSKAELVKRMGLKNELRPVSVRNSNGALESFKWRIDGDYFDVRSLNLEVPSGDIQPRYMIELNVRASDNNYDTGPKVSANSEPIRLLVVSPGDLLYEISKDEEAIGLKLDDAIKKLEAARKKFEFVRSKNGFAGLEEVNAVKVRSKDAAQDCGKAREGLQAVLREFRRIEKECIYNQLDEKNVAAYGTFGNRVDRVLGEVPFPVSPAEDEAESLRVRSGAPQRATFPILEKLMDIVQTSFDADRWADGVIVSNVDNTLKGLLDELTSIRQALGEGESFDKVKREVGVLLEQQRRVQTELKNWDVINAGTLVQDTPEILPVGAVFLAKGEVQKIKHNIRWRQYKEDSLTVKLVASDPNAIVVPSELKLDFEKNDLNFEYEVRAGSKAGDYSIVLTPASGTKVEVKVTVK